MDHRDFTLTLTVDQSPEEVFAAVTNVRGWWSQGLEGRSAEVGDAFTYRHGELHRSTHQVTEAEPGKTFLVYEAAGITPSAAAPLTEIKDQVAIDWRKTEGNKAAKAAAQRVMQRLAAGQDLAAALAAAKIALPPAQAVDMGRDDLAKQPQVPPVLALMFSMAKGTVKRLEGPQSNGWFVVKLDDVSLPPIDPNDPLIGATQQQLAGVFGEEYAEELIHATQHAVGVKKNQTAIDAVAKQLTGRSE